MIMLNLDNRAGDVGVTVICTTFNHSRYIRRCLDGFVAQRTNFRFEVLIHDDASTDGTQEIVREYAAKYPDIFKVLLQIENQYSKGGFAIITKTMLPYIVGKYVASCEGDDFWCDPLKLQSQYDALEENENCKFSVCQVRVITEDEKCLIAEEPGNHLREGLYSSKDFLRTRVMNEFQTSGYFYNGDEWRKYTQDPPEFRRVADIGDLPILLYFAQLGDVYFVRRVMSCYRSRCAGSWTSRQSKESILRHAQTKMRIFEAYNKYTNGLYADECAAYMRRYRFEYAWKGEDYRECMRREYAPFRKKLGKRARVRFFLMAYLPWIVNFYRKFRH